MKNSDNFHTAAHREVDKVGGCKQWIKPGLNFRPFPTRKHLSLCGSQINAGLFEINSCEKTNYAKSPLQHI